MAVGRLLADQDDLARLSPTLRLQERTDERAAGSML
jgi:hypothetical protein